MTLFEPRLFEPKSLFPGNRILRAETKAPKRPRRSNDVFAETRAHANNPANSGLVAEIREISVSVGMRGGRTRTRTLDPLIKRHHEFSQLNPIGPQPHK